MTDTPASRLISFGRTVCGDLADAESREWLVTNGIGGYASGTIAGVLTRRYHGLLVAALKPPLGRTLLVTKLDETVRYDGADYPLSANRWADGSVSDHGYRHIEEFHLEGTTPVWSFGCADALLEKRIFMKSGENTTYVLYTLRRATVPMSISLKTFVNYRDYHGSTIGGDWKMTLLPEQNGLRVVPYEGATPFSLLSDKARIEPMHEWYRNFDLVVERSRGLSDSEDHLLAGNFAIVLQPGESFTIVATTNHEADPDGERNLLSRQNQELLLLDQAATVVNGLAPPPWINQLTLAASQFVVARPSEHEPDGKSLIAGYHWFGDWGRDTMISLPGLTLATGQSGIAQSILRTFARFVNQGMLPNRFPDAGEDPEYNTADATLWYVAAMQAYHESTGDDALLRELFPVFEEIIARHVQGTRYHIHVDGKDGLLYAGEEGVQLTWMDAKIGDWVVTPRTGKPVEINALWYNALVAMSAFALRLGMPADGYATMAARAATGFQKFWNDRDGYCYDVIDGTGGNDNSLRPNQIIAVALPECPLTLAQRKQVVDVCGRRLLASTGIRSLSPDDTRFSGHYGGGQYGRDSVYHQGTSWAWLLPLFALAHFRVHRNAEAARSFLEPVRHHLTVHGLGSMSEIFDGDPPFTPRGCIAQAWSVAEVLRVWNILRKQSGTIQ